MAYRSSSIRSGNSTTPIGDAPAGLTNDDWMLAMIVCDGSKTISSAPSGWDLVATFSNAGPDVQSAFLYEKVASSEGAAWTWNASATGPWLVIVGCWSGRNTAGSLTSQVTIDDTSRDSAISVALSGVTAASGDDIAWFAQLDLVGGADIWGFAAPSSYTERQDGLAEQWIAGSLATRDNVSSGGTGTLTGTATRTSGSSNAGFSGVVVAIPASGGGGGSGSDTGIVQMVESSTNLIRITVPEETA